MKTLTEHLVQYAAYHRDKRNIITHFIGIPMIVLAIAILLSRPMYWVEGLALTPAWIMALGLGAFYLTLDLALGLLMALLLALCVWAGVQAAQEPTELWLSVGIGLFVLGWVIQFIGHYFEGKKPAFFDDIMGLAVGPIFVVAELIFMLGGLKRLRQQVEAKAGPIRN